MSDAFRLEDCTGLLRRTPAVLRSLLGGLPEDWIRAREGAGTWCAFDVLGHLIHGDRTNWIPRARMIVERRSDPFPPFDREAMLAADRGRAPGDLLDEFDRVRDQALAALAAMEPGAGRLSWTGRHPEFGEVTLAQLLATWAAHDLDHLHQVSRVLAKRLSASVGPWSAFLGVLRCGPPSPPPGR